MVNSIETKYKALLDVECKFFPKGVIATKYGPYIIPPNTLSDWIGNSETIKSAYETYSFAPNTKRMRQHSFKNWRQQSTCGSKKLRAQSIPI